MAAASLIKSFEVKHLFVHPIKSCQAFEVQSAKITKWGLEHDRRWAIVAKETSAGDDVKWHVENIYEMKPELARIKPSIEDGNLRLQAHGFPDLLVPIRTKAGEKPKLFINPIHGSTPSIDHVEDEGEDAAEWITEVLSAPDVSAKASAAPTKNLTYHLVWMPPDVSAKCAANKTYGHLFNPDEEMSFAAKAQYLVTNEASLDEVNRSIEKMGDRPVDMCRFRSNIVVRGEPFEEETWKAVRIGRSPTDVVLRTCLAAIRCQETTVHMHDHQGGWGGDRDPSGQPFKALKKYHTGPTGKPRFGLAMNRCLVESTVQATISVGDHLTVVERSDESMLEYEMADKGTSQKLSMKLKSHAEVDRIADMVESAAEMAHSGDGTIENVGIRLEGQVQCPECRQRFGSEKAMKIHWNFIHDPNRHQED